ncbi:hypothetical protein DFP74_1398 [Nocardiopsis sp. Huas11]|uniref:hypothetical protein n=1 Tax=Nocardiopsis sp. Huas11 TaxID=2183912 RepID=UPI000F29188C|nr:hypothetical protein [Nocardiopsis sp. Huas11]RKS05786.1 hypothetical protein DFP74_1398 [Nocardiopsis sp. Huas11]
MPGDTRTRPWLLLPGPTRPPVGTRTPVPPVVAPALRAVLHTLGWTSPTAGSVGVQVHLWNGSGARLVEDRSTHLEVDGPRTLVPTSAGVVVTVPGGGTDGGVVRVIGLA